MHALGFSGLMKQIAKEGGNERGKLIKFQQGRANLETARFKWSHNRFTKKIVWNLLRNVTNAAGIMELH